MSAFGSTVFWAGTYDERIYLAGDAGNQRCDKEPNGIFVAKFDLADPDEIYPFTCRQSFDPIHRPQVSDIAAQSVRFVLLRFDLEHRIQFCGSYRSTTIVQILHGAG